jgi:hypothetical protein
MLAATTDTLLPRHTCTPPLQDTHDAAAANDLNAGRLLTSKLEWLGSPAAQGVLAAKRQALAHLRHMLDSQAAAELEGLLAAARGYPKSVARQH